MIFIITITLFFVILRVSTVNMLLAKIYTILILFGTTQIPSQKHASKQLYRTAPSCCFHYFLKTICFHYLLKTIWFKSENVTLFVIKNLGNWLKAAFSYSSMMNQSQNVLILFLFVWSLYCLTCSPRISHVERFNFPHTLVNCTTCNRIFR